MEEQKFENGGFQYVPQIAQAVQYVYLDFDGESTSYNGEILTINNVEVKDSSLPEERIEKIVSTLNTLYAQNNIVFVTKKPTIEEYSTIYIGKTNAFSSYGNFTGLAETIDTDNKNNSDNAFVLLDYTASDEQIISTICHETNHLLGTLDHGGEGLNAYADNITVGHGVISSGLMITSANSLTVSSGGIANDTTVSGRTADYGGLSACVFIENGGVINNTYASHSSYIYLSSGGTANSTTISIRARMYISNGGIANYTTINENCYLFISNGGKVSNTTLGHYGHIYAAGIMDKTTVCGGSMTISNGGIANDTTILNGFLHLSSGGSANKTIIVGSPGYVTKMLVDSGGIANSTTIKANGYMAISSGGTATAISIENSGCLYLTVASDTYIQGTSNGSAFEMKDAYIAGYTVNSAGTMVVESGGSANNTTVNNFGSMHIVYGIANNTTVNNFGYMHINEGIANNTTVNSGGCLIIAFGGTHKGYLQIASGAYVSSYSGWIEFTIADRTPEDNYLINNLSLILGDPRYYITISDVQEFGTYKLAQGAESFSGGQITIRTEKTSYGSIYVNGETFVHDDREYTLTQNSGNLTLTIAQRDIIAPELIINGNPTEWTNKDITLTVTVNEESTILYRIDNGEWQLHTNGVTISTTAIVDFKATDLAGNVTEKSIIIDKIDKEVPVITILSDNNNKFAETVTLTAEITDKNLKSAEYSIDGITWTNYTTPIKMTNNGTVYFRAVDVAGNSITSSYNVNNIGELPIKIYNSNGSVVSKAAEMIGETIGYGTNTIMHISSGGIANSTELASCGYQYISSGGITNSTTIRGGVLHIYSSGIASDTSIVKGELYVSYAGTAENTIINSDGVMYIEGLASNTTVNSGGSVYISSGGMAYNTTVSGGLLDISSSGIVNSTTIANGVIGIISGGTANNTTITDHGFMYIFNGGTASYTTVNSYCSMHISNGGVANEVNVNKGGRIFIARGGVANNITVSMGGISVHGGTVNDTIVFNRGYVTIYTGAIANNTTISNGVMTIKNGTASNTIINSNGSMIIDNGTANSTTINGGSIDVYGIANHTTVNVGGYIHINGTANSTTVNSDGNITVSSGGIASDTTVKSNGYMTISSGGMHHGNLQIETGAIVSACEGSIINFAIAERTTEDEYLINNLSLISGAPTYTITVSANQGLGNYKLAQNASNFNGSITISDGTTQYGSITVNGDALTYGNYKYSLTVNNNNLTLDIAENKAIFIYSSGTLTSSGGIITGATLASGGNNSMHISSGGTAYNTIVNENGYMHISNGGIALSTTINSSGNLHVSSGGVANNTTLNSFGQMFIYEGGYAKGITLTQGHEGDMLTVYSGGSAEDVIVKNGGDFDLIGGYASNIELHNDFTEEVTTDRSDLFITSGLAENITVDGYSWVRIQSNGIANSAVINSGGSMQVDRSGIAKNVIITSGGSLIIGETLLGKPVLGGTAMWVNIQDGGFCGVGEQAVISSAVVNSGGSLYLGAGGGASAYDTKVNSSGKLTIDAKNDGPNGHAKLYGNQIFGGTVEIINLETQMDMQGSSITFDIQNRQAEDSFIINNISWFTNATYCIQVSSDQEYGEYKLAKGADSFTGNISIGDGTTTYGSIAIGGGIFNYNNVDYKLSNTGGNLNLHVGDFTPPDAPIAVANITTLTNQDVLITVNYSNDSTIKQYRIGNSEEWLDYSDTFVVTDNATIYFRAEDAAGNESTSQLVIDYIDKIAPTLDISGNATEWTNKDVTLTANASDGTIEFFNGESWVKDNTIIATKNGTYTFRVTDAANNVTEKSVIVDKIDKDAPALVISGNVTSWTNQDVTLTASASDACGVTIYYKKLGDSEFTKYDNAIVSTQNDTYIFYAVDSLGNVSAEQTIVVDKIDKVAPTLDITGNATTWTNQDVVLTASCDEGVIEFFNGESWVEGNAITATENGVYQFRVTDNAGNVTEKSVIVDKIDKSKPQLSIISDNTEPYANTVTLTASVVEDNLVSLEYSFNNNTWQTYSGPITITSNLTVNFRASDLAGNITYQNYEVNNIGIAPVQIYSSSTMTSSGGTINGVVISGNNSMYVSSGGVTNNTTITSYGKMYIYSSGMANSAMVNSDGCMYISSGGSANSTTVNSGGRIFICSGGNAINTTITGTTYTYMTVYSGGSANNISVNTGTLYVDSNAVVQNVTIAESNGNIYVASNAIVQNLTVSAGGAIGGFIFTGNKTFANISNGSVIINNNVNIIGSQMHISSGGIMTDLKTKRYQYALNGSSTREGIPGIFVHSGGTLNRAILSSASLQISSGGVANSTNLNTYSYMGILSGGTANNTIINSHGSMYISEGGVHRGSLQIFSGGNVSAYAGSIIDFNIVNRTTTDYYLINNLSLISGAPTYTITVSANQTQGTYKLAQGASNFNETISIGDDTTIYGSITVNGSLTYGLNRYTLTQNNGYLTLSVSDIPTVFIYSSGTLTSSGTTINNAIISGAYNSMHVSSGGIVNSTNVITRAHMMVYSGGVANNTNLYSHAQMHMYSGANVSNLKIYSYASGFISSGAVISNVYVSGFWAWFYAQAGATTYNTTLAYDAVQQTAKGATAYDTIVNNKASHYVHGSSYNATIYLGGYEGVEKTAYASGTLIYSGGSQLVLGIVDKANIKGTMSINKTGIGNYNTINYSGKMYLSGGTANNTIINSEGGMYVLNGGTANNTIVNSEGSMYISNGGAAQYTSVGYYGDLNIYEGGLANNTVVDNYGDMYISSGGTANETTVKSNGELFVYDQGVVSNTIISSGGKLLINSGGTAVNVENSSGKIVVSTGALLQSATVRDTVTEQFVVFGTTDKINIFDGADMQICSGGYATNIVLSGSSTESHDTAQLRVSEGGIISNTSVMFMGDCIVSATAYQTTIYSGGQMQIQSGGFALDIYVAQDANLLLEGSSETATVAENVTIYGQTHLGKYTLLSQGVVHSGGQLWLGAGGGASASILQINSGGTVYIDAENGDKKNGNAKLYGDQIFGGSVLISNNNSIMDMQGSTITFAIEERCSQDQYIVNDLSWFTNTNYAIHVDCNQAFGTYRLAQGASNFTGTISIGDGTTNYGSITVNGEVFKYNDVDYLITQENGNLILYIGDFTPPEIPIVTANTTTWTNQNVVISVLFSEDCTVKQYRIGANDEWQNYSEALTITDNETIYFRAKDSAGNEINSQYVINYIDKVAPNLDISGNATQWTNQDVTLTAKVSDGIVEFFNGKEWITGDVQTVTDNGTYTFKVTDAAGNVTEKDVVVSFIDKIAPTLDITGNATQWTNQDVTLTANVSDGIVEFFNGKEWIMGDVQTVTDNGTYTFKVTDAAGNVTEKDVVVSFIDKVAPDKPNASADITFITNKDVTITATFSEDSVTKQYSINGKDWEIYTDAIVMTNSGVVTFRGIDTAGNISYVTTYEVTNIDKIAPTIEILGNSTQWTNQDVTLTAKVSDGVVEFFNGKEWIDGNVQTVTDNGTYTFKVTDAAGNVTEKDVVVDKIDKVAPTLDITGNATQWTNQDVTLTAKVSDGVVEFFNGKEWITGEVQTVTDNGTYKFKVTDAAGNVTEKDVEVSFIDKVAPVAPVATANITSITNKDVIISATFSEDSVIKQYSINGKDWETYTNDIVMNNNGIVTFRGIDAAGNISDVTSYEVTNIDKVAPTLNITGNPTQWTNQDVTLTANVSDGVVEFFNGKEWITGDVQTVTDNGTYTFKVTDIAGNVTIKDVEVSFIDKIAPTLDITGNATTWTNKDVTLTANVSDGKVEFFNGKNWVTGSTHTVTENGKYTYKVTDEAGNVTTKDVEVSFIDKVAPTLNITGNPTNWTNKDVTLSASANEDSIIEFFNGTNWVTGSTHTVSNNGTYTFKVTDIAGNVTIKDVIVDKVDKTNPLFDIKTDAKIWSNQDVTIKANVNENGCTIQYQIDNGSWQQYSKNVVVSENCTINFKVTDKAGNIVTKSVTIDSIDESADSLDSTTVIFISSKYNEKTTGKKQDGIVLTYGENAFSTIEDALAKYPYFANNLVVMVDSKTDITESINLPVVAGTTVTPTIKETDNSYSYKATSQAKNSITITKDTGNTEFIRFATVDVNGGDVENIIGGKLTNNKETQTVADKKGTVTTTDKFTNTTNATGKFTATNNATIENVENYSTVNLIDATIENVTAGNTKLTTSSKIVDAYDKYQKTISCVDDNVAAGSITLTDGANASEINAFANVTLNNATAGNISNFTSKDSKSETTTFDEGKKTVTRKVTLSHTENTAGTLKATNVESLDDVTGFATVTLLNVNDAGDFKRVDENGNKYSTVKETLDVKTNKDKTVTGKYTKTETFTRNGKLTATNSNIGDIANYSTVTLDGTSANNISNFQEAKIVTTGTATWKNMDVYSRPNDYDLTLEDFDLIVTTTKSLNGSVTLKNNAKAESITNYQTVTLSNSTVDEISNVNKVSISKGKSIITSYKGTDENDTLSIAKDAVLVAKSINLGLEAKDTINLAGTIILTGREIVATNITGKGEIVATSDVYKKLDINFANVLDIGETAENFKGTAFETSDNTLKKAAKWDPSNQYDGWMGSWSGTKDGSDEVDFITFKANAGDTLVITNIENSNWTLFDKKGNEIVDVTIFNNNTFLARGEYILKLENNEDKSISYSVKLA